MLRLCPSNADKSRRKKMEDVQQYSLCKGLLCHNFQQNIYIYLIVLSAQRATTGNICSTKLRIRFKEHWIFVITWWERLVHSYMSSTSDWRESVNLTSASGPLHVAVQYHAFQSNNITPPTVLVPYAQGSQMSTSSWTGTLFIRQVCSFRRVQWIWLKMRMILREKKWKRLIWKCSWMNSDHLQQQWPMVVSAL